MMLTGHVVFALGTTQLGRRTLPRLNKVDWRFVALAPLLPDVIDKSLAFLISPLVSSHPHATRLVAHTLWPSLLLFAVTLLFRPGWLPYTLAFSSHLVADQMWEIPATLLWPAYGWTVFSGESVSLPQAVVHTHGIDLTRLLQVGLELAALVVLAWLVRRYRLWHWHNLRNLLLTGQVSDSSVTRIQYKSSDDL